MPQARPTHLRAHQAQPGKAGPAPRTSLWPTALLAPLTLALSACGGGSGGDVVIVVTAAVARRRPSSRLYCGACCVGGDNIDGRCWLRVASASSPSAFLLRRSNLLLVRCGREEQFAWDQRCDRRC